MSFKSTSFRDSRVEEGVSVYGYLRLFHESIEVGHVL